MNAEKPARIPEAFSRAAAFERIWAVKPARLVLAACAGEVVLAPPDPAAATAARDTSATRRTITAACKTLTNDGRSVRDADAGSDRHLDRGCGRSRAWRRRPPRGRPRPVP